VEIPAVAIVNTLRNRQGLQRLSRFELDVLYSRPRRTCGGICWQLREAALSGLADSGRAPARLPLP